MTAMALEDQIETSAAAPKKVTVDGETSDEHPLPDLIEADEYLGGKAANTRRTLPIRLAKIHPPGTT